MSYEFYLLLACLVLLVILLIRQTSLTHRQETERMQQEHSLTVLGNQLLDNLDAQWIRLIVGYVHRVILKDQRKAG